MARMLRTPFLAEGQHYHVYSRFAAHRPLFETREAKEEFLRLLEEYATRFNILIHGLCLMTNHFHVLCSIGEGGDLSSCFGKTKEMFSKWHNGRRRAQGADGPLWKERFKMTLIESDWHALLTLKYIENNPVRAGMVRNAWDYEWSSTGFYAGGAANPLIKPLASYLALSADVATRQRMWQEWLERQAREDRRKMALLFRGRPYGWVGALYLGSPEYVRTGLETAGQKLDRKMQWQNAVFNEDLSCAIPGN